MTNHNAKKGGRLLETRQCNLETAVTAGAGGGVGAGGQAKIRLMIRGWVSPACTAPHVSPADRSSARGGRKLIICQFGHWCGGGSS